MCVLLPPLTGSEQVFCLSAVSPTRCHFDTIHMKCTNLTYFYLAANILFWWVVEERGEEWVPTCSKVCSGSVKTYCIACQILCLINLKGCESFCGTHPFTSCSAAVRSAASFCPAHSGTFHLSAHINWCCFCSCLIIYLCLPFLPFHPFCHLCHLFLGYPHSHLLLGARWDLVCQAGPVPQGRCRSVVALLSVCSQTAVRRHSGIDRQLPSMPTSSNL